jgi:hypothetical protein
MSKKPKNDRPPRHKTPGSPDVDSTPAQRVTWLLSTVWHGNQSLMAREVGCVQSVISKIVAGQQHVGSRLLMRIATYPSLNPTWLLTGEGEPFLPVVTPGPGTEEGATDLPIARQILPGPPELHRKLLFEERFPTAAADIRSTRYWLELTGDQPIVRHGGHSLRADDLLLMETDANYRKDVHQVDGELCAVRLPKGPRDGTKMLKLAMVTYHSDQDETYLQAQPFEFSFDRQKLHKRVIIEIDSGSQKGIHVQAPEFYVEEKGRKRSLSTHTGQLEPQNHFIRLDDIVAVCQQMVRRDVAVADWPSHLPRL